MMGTPASATPDSSTWSGLTGHSTPLHGPLHSSPLVHNAMHSPGPSSKNHSTPQRLCYATPKFGRGGLTPAKHFDSKLLSSVRSPYQKSYTPLSATPSGHSPAFKTPIRMTNNSPHPVRTPLGTKLPHSARKMVTPQSGLINPFEDALFATYHESVLSPGLFAFSETPCEKKASRSFRWSIDQLAVLHPADIDENTCQESQRSRFDREVEETAQLAISNFFAANNIVASPWPDSSGRPVFVATPKSPSQGTCVNSGDGEKTRPKKTQDASCQTTLTLPMGFNLEKILGEFMTYMGQEEDNNQQESLSNSSLRRKLFFHGEASPFHSPVRKAEESLAMHCDEATESFKPLSIQSHSDKFSSSPITLSKGDHFARVSDEMDGICSPELSPIELKHSSGMKNHGGSFMSKSHSRSASMRQQNAMASPELSPIVPGGKVGSRLSLDVSPICSPLRETANVLSPIQQQSEPVLSVEHGVNTPVSALQINGLSPALSTPSTVGTSKASEGSNHVTMATLVTTPGFSNTCNLGTPVTDAPLPPCDQSDKPLPFSGLAFQEPRLLMSDISMDVTGMETEYAVNSTELPHPDNVPDHRNFGFPVSRDCSMLYEETTNPSCISSNIPTSHSQDTGYQTGSLQLTNQDTGLLQTNLTNQFSSLPFKSYSDPDGMDEGLDMEQNQAERALPKPVILKEKLEPLNTSVVSRQLNYHTSLPSTKAAFTKEKVSVPKVSDYLKTEVEGCSLIHEGLTEDEVIAKARFILGQNISVLSAVPSRPKEPADSSAPSMSWQPTCSSTPQKTQLSVTGLQSPAEGQLPSEVAMKILRRAERALEELSTLPSSTVTS